MASTSFIGLESSLEAEISMSYLTFYNLFVGEKKKNCYFGMNFSFTLIAFIHSMLD